MDIKQRITNHITNIIDRATLPGKSQWTTAAAGGFPINTKTGRYYRGINALQLWFKASQKGYPCNIWLTHTQLRPLGITPLEGEKGVLCCYFDKHGACRPVFVYNIAQLTGVSPELATYPAGKLSFDPITEGQKTLELYGSTFRSLRGDKDKLSQVVEFLIVQAAKQEAAHWL